MPSPWLKSSSRQLGDFRIFTIRSDVKISPRTGNPHDFFLIECVNWVNVIALTPEGQLVMIRQFRHGSNTVELEVPGGMIDPQDSSPESAAIRELREETGFEGEQPRIIGQIFPNPAIMTNTCFTVLVQNCRKLHPVDFEQGEDLVTQIVSPSDIPALITGRTIQHGVVVAALYHFDLWQRTHHQNT